MSEHALAREGTRKRERATEKERESEKENNKENRERHTYIYTFTYTHTQIVTGTEIETDRNRDGDNAPSDPRTHHTHHVDEYSIVMICTYACAYDIQALPHRPSIEQSLNISSNL